MEKTKVMMLGTFHFTNGGQHLYNSDTPDMLSEKKQREVDELLNKLIKFKPTKIAVEAQRSEFEELNKVYCEYVNTSLWKENPTIGHRNEIVQVGFELAKRLNHEKIYPVDYKMFLPDEAYEEMQKNYPELYKEIDGYYRDYTKEDDRLMKEGTVIDSYKFLNDPKRIKEEHSIGYLNLCRVGAGDKYYGVDMITEWYRRNLYILSNIQDIAEPEDRILVIYGAGHCEILRTFIEEYHKFELVEPLDYLNA